MRTPKDPCSRGSRRKCAEHNIEFGLGGLGAAVLRHRAGWRKMELQGLTCVVCDRGFSVAEAGGHRHPEARVGSTAANSWLPVWSPQAALVTDDSQSGVWRFARHLPASRVRPSLGEGNTPLEMLPLLSQELELSVYLKREDKNPTGSFKDRGMALLTASALSSNKTRVALPSTGNAAVSLTAYAKQAGLDALLFISVDCDAAKRKALNGGQLVVRDTLIDAWEAYEEFCARSTDVYRGMQSHDLWFMQGLKTIAFELYLQLGGRAPDWVVIPCGSGSSVVGIYLGFLDLLNMGLIRALPRLVPVQIAGGDPIRHGLERARDATLPVIEQPTPSRSVLSCDTNFNFHAICAILSKTAGVLASVRDDEIEEWNTHPDVSRTDLEFSAVAAFAGLKSIASRVVRGDSVVLMGTGTRLERLCA